MDRAALPPTTIIIIPLLLYSVYTKSFWKAQQMLYAREDQENDHAEYQM